MSWPTPRGQDEYERRNWKTVKRINEEGGDLTLPSKVLYMARMAPTVHANGDPSDTVNRTHRLKALGNGIVPLCALPFALAIYRALEESCAAS